MMALVYLLCYLLGAFPTGLIITRSHKIDISKIGSGNVGATNVSRALGLKWGLITLIVDILKGFLAVQLGYYWGLTPELCGSLAVAGHIFSIPPFLRGGKGVATFIGVLLSVNFVAFLTFCIAVTALFLITKIVSLSCLLGIIFTISSLYLLGAAYIEVWILVAVLIIFAHRSNISRLVKGEEPKFSFKQR